MNINEIKAAFAAFTESNLQLAAWAEMKEDAILMGRKAVGGPTTDAAFATWWGKKSKEDKASMRDALATALTGVAGSDTTVNTWCLAIGMRVRKARANTRTPAEQAVIRAIGAAKKGKMTKKAMLAFIEANWA